MQYIEDGNSLDPKNADYARALKNLQEELEAISYYQQRAALASNPELKSVVEHNRDEEIEHCCMLIEWLRRNMPAWDENLKTYLFTSAPLTEVEDASAEGGASGGSDGDLSLRGLK
jgi:ferritin-like protein